MIYALRRSLLGQMHCVWQREREPGLVHTTGGMVLRGGSPSPSSPRPRGPALASGTPSCRQHGPCASRSTSKAFNSCKKQSGKTGSTRLAPPGSPHFNASPPKLPEATPMNRPATPLKRPCCWKRDGGCLGQPFIRHLVRRRRDPLLTAARPPRTSITRTRKTHASTGCSSASPAFVETMRRERGCRRDGHGLPRRRPRRPIVSAGHEDVLRTRFVARGRRDRRRAGRPRWPRQRRDGPELVERTSSR